MGPFIKIAERLGRKLLLAAFALLAGGRRWPLLRPQSGQRILLVRLDERLGNAILMTPMLVNLQRMLPNVHLDVVVAEHARAVLQGHALLHNVFVFNKRKIFGSTGLLAQLRKLRRNGYTLAIDGANPTHPSLTHALVVRFCGAKATLGFATGLQRRLYSCAVSPPKDPLPSGETQHEIDLRLSLLEPLGLERPCRAMCISEAMALPKDSQLPSFLRSLNGALFVLINVGARIRAKQLKAADYAVIANTITVAGMVPVLSFGPSERQLADDVVNFSAQAVLAPPTCVTELMHLMAQSLCVISCDTGPMHLAVAIDKPTCGLFVSTDPARYGHQHGPHVAIDARDKPQSAWMPKVRAFLRDQRLCEVRRPKAPALLPDEMTPLFLEGPEPLGRDRGWADTAPLF